MNKHLHDRCMAKVMTIIYQKAYKQFIFNYVQLFFNKTIPAVKIKQKTKKQAGHYSNK